MSAGVVGADPSGPELPWSATVDGWMLAALEEARLASAGSDVPVGAHVYDASGALIGTGRNRREVDGDPTAHAEILALRSAAATTGDWQLNGCTLVVTLEPCVMCAGALTSARISTVVFGAWDGKAGAVGSLYDVVRDRRLPQRAEVIAGVRAAECAALLEEFFEARR